MAPVQTKGSLSEPKRKTKDYIGRIYVFTNKLAKNECNEAKALIKDAGGDASEIKVDTKPYLFEIMSRLSNGKQDMPQIFFNDSHIGGINDLRDLKDNGSLNELVEEAKNADNPGRLYKIYRRQTDIFSISPTDLYFPPPLNRPITCVVRITNKTDKYAIFKLKTNSPKRYLVKPKQGVLGPNAQEKVEVILQQKGLDEIPTSSDKFRVEGVVLNYVNEGLLEMVEEMFKKVDAKTIVMQKLQCFFENPPTNMKITQYNDGITIEELNYKTNFVDELLGDDLNVSFMKRSMASNASDEDEDLLSPRNTKQPALTFDTSAPVATTTTTSQFVNVPSSPISSTNTQQIQADQLAAQQAVLLAQEAEQNRLREEQQRQQLEQQAREEQRRNEEQRQLDRDNQARVQAERQAQEAQLAREQEELKKREQDQQQQLEQQRREKEQRDLLETEQRKLVEQQMQMQRLREERDRQARAAMEQQERQIAEQNVLELLEKETTKIVSDRSSAKQERLEQIDSIDRAEHQRLLDEHQKVLVKLQNSAQRIKEMQIMHESELQREREKNAILERKVDSEALLRKRASKSISNESDKAVGEKVAEKAVVAAEHPTTQQFSIIVLIVVAILAFLAGKLI
ncbi:vesicle-associated protein [Acrasis kona]|uniref:Vesicle-associated protein n=1 Tax=Acrasis kona TaxID=1008807 RepID=A0AAW2Z9K9_9EUKA